MDPYLGAFLDRAATVGLDFGSKYAQGWLAQQELQDRLELQAKYAQPVAGQISTSTMLLIGGIVLAVVLLAR